MIRGDVESTSEAESSEEESKEMWAKSKAKESKKRKLSDNYSSEDEESEYESNKRGRIEREIKRDVEGCVSLQVTPYLFNKTTCALHHAVVCWHTLCKMAKGLARIPK